MDKIASTAAEQRGVTVDELTVFQRNFSVVAAAEKAGIYAINL